jgi:hypothetical protein
MLEMTSIADGIVGLAADGIVWLAADAHDSYACSSNQRMSVLEGPALLLVTPHRQNPLRLR